MPQASTKKENKYQHRDFDFTPNSSTWEWQHFMRFKGLHVTVCVVKIKLIYRKKNKVSANIA
jgi:hypothetical protein